ncbi:MAG: hypothetical protein K8R54_00635 [Bacteroidales bacterium]|nr:hypothetical protein [Bacteroidales bacterium]
MKKLLFAIIFAAFLFGCKSEDNNDKDDNSVIDTIVVENNPEISDTIEIILTEEEVALKSDEILQKSEDINSKLDDLLNNL